MSKKINKQNTKKSLQQLRAKRKQYAEGGVPEEEKRIDPIAAKKGKSQAQYQADSRKAAQQFTDAMRKSQPKPKTKAGPKRKTGNEGDIVRPAVESTTGYKNSGIVTPPINLDSLDKEPRRKTYRTSQKEPGSRETPSDIKAKTGNDDAGGMPEDTVENNFWWEDYGYESLPEALADGWVYNKQTGTFQQTGNTGNGGNSGAGGTDDEFTGGGNVKQIGTGAPLELAQRNPEYTAVEMEAESVFKAVPEAEQRADEYVAQYPEWDETQKAEAREWAVKAFKDNKKNPEMPDWLMDSDFLKGLEAANNLEIDTTKTVAPE